MKIIGVGRQAEGGGYLRIRLPLNELAKHGHETRWFDAKSDVRADDADIVVGQLIGDKNNQVIVHNWWRQLRRHSKLVYELDDDPFEIEAHNPVYWGYSGAESHDSLRHCMEIADLVTVSTEPLAERMRKINPNIVILKNCVDEFVLDMDRPRRDKVTIGWAGSNTHLQDMKEAAYGLRKTIDHNPHAEAHFIGYDCRSVIGRPIRFTPWAKKTIDYYKLIDFDIGIAPLIPTVFAETKSYIKALDYAALGIPTVASDVAPYRDFIIDGVTGFLVRREHEWAQRLRDLVNDDAMREEMGAKAKEVARGYTIQQRWPQWEAAYRSVLERAN